MSNLNHTHNPNLESWLESANAADTDFPIQNLPIAEFRRAGSGEAFRGGIAIGDQVIDLAELNSKTDLEGELGEALSLASRSRLNDYMALKPSSWSALRHYLSASLEKGSDEQALIESCLVPQSSVEYDLPCLIGDYTDFYTSIYHATSVGKLFRPDNPLLPNYKWVPIGYHGRASSVVMSGVNFHRPHGQLKAPDAEQPSLQPCKRLDHELELGIFVGGRNPLGGVISIDEAEDYAFGICLFNDWSARDIQAWEYQPLGPFLAKNFISSISPWIISMEALEPFRVPFTRPEQDPQPLPYLTSEKNSEQGSIDIKVESFIQTETMRSENQEAERISSSSFKHSYWSVAQLLTHHAINGCNIQAGDLLGSGTQSGPEAEEAGSMLELSEGGKKPITLANGEQRTFLEDGDSVVLRGHCERQGARRIGFGEVVATILPAKELPAKKLS